MLLFKENNKSYNFGIGYVGLVQAAVLASVGHDVVCVDIDQAKVDNLKKGLIPIYEPGLTPLVQETYKNGQLNFTTDAKAGVEHGQIQFIAVGTPPNEDGSADFKYVLTVAETIATYMGEPKIITDKSTVPVGMADKVSAKVSSVLSSLKVDLNFDVVSNPEFLKEGAAVSECMKPDCIVVGTESESAQAAMREASAMVLMEALWQKCAKLQAYDPEAMEECHRIYGSQDDLSLVGTKESALNGTDALVVCTEWS